LTQKGGHADMMKPIVLLRIRTCLRATKCCLH